MSDRASQVLAQGVPPGVPKSYRALVDHGGIPRVAKCLALLYIIVMYYQEGSSDIAVALLVPSISRGLWIDGGIRGFDAISLSERTGAGSSALPKMLF